MTLAVIPWGNDPCFVWDEHNEEEVAKHRVSCFDVEECFENKYKAIPHNKARSQPKKYGDRFLISGTTHGGRKLFIVIQYLGAGFVRPITAFDINR